MPRAVPRCRPRYDAFLDEVKAYSSPYLSLGYIAGNSVDKEIERSVSADLYLIVSGPYAPCL